jgi:large subunit ribosomal protein L14
METKLFVSDNSGVKLAKCIKVLNSAKRLGGKPGDIVILAARKVKNTKKYLKGDICRAVLIRLRRNVQRYTGICIATGDNSVILIDQKNVPLASRIFGPILKELRYGNYPKVVSLAKTVL